MINKKVCLLGAFSVGKTSLVEQYVHSIFSDKYLSSVGVKISKKSMMADGKEVTLVLWDMEGKDIYAEINLSYLRGAMGYFVVLDGTRHETLDAALELHSHVVRIVGEVPCFFLINKADISDQWQISQGAIKNLTQRGINVLCTSAKTGENVSQAFESLTKMMCSAKP
jgi:small GTP-binding protein domain